MASKKPKNKNRAVAMCEWSLPLPSWTHNLFVIVIICRFRLTHSVYCGAQPSSKTVEKYQTGVSIYCRTDLIVLENNLNFEQRIGARLAITVDGSRQFLERPLDVETERLFHHVIHFLRVVEPLLLDLEIAATHRNSVDSYCYFHFRFKRPISGATTLLVGI